MYIFCLLQEKMGIKIPLYSILLDVYVLSDTEAYEYQHHSIRFDPYCLSVLGACAGCPVIRTRRHEAAQRRSRHLGSSPVHHTACIASR